MPLWRLGAVGEGLRAKLRKQSLIALAEIDALAQQAGIAADAGFDLRQNFSITSGLPQSDPAHQPPTLASALGIAAPTGPARISPGSSLRLIVRAEKAAPLMLVFRTTGLLDRPVLISDRASGFRHSCSAGQVPDRSNHGAGLCQVRRYRARHQNSAPVTKIRESSCKAFGIIPTLTTPSPPAAASQLRRGRFPASGG